MKICVRPNTWGLLLILCGLFTSIQSNASVCYGLASSGSNTLEVSLTSDINYSQTPTPTSSWTTGAFTLCWPAALGPNIISSFNNVSPLPYAYDFTPTLVGGNYCQKFTFVGPIVLDLTAGVVTDVVQINLNTSCTVSASDFFIDNFPSDPPVANGTASLINFFGEEFAVGACTLTANVGLNANPITATPVDVSTCGGTVNVDAAPSGGTAPYTFSWTDLGTGSSTGYTLSNQATQTLTINASAATSGTIDLQVMVTDDDGCQGTGTATVTVIENATADAGADQSVCGFQSVVISAMANGPGMWSGGAGSIGQATNQNTAYTPAASEIGTTVTLTWTTTDPDGAGSCTNASDTVDITFVEEADAGADASFTFCSSGAMTNITPVGADPGGSFSPALASGTGMFNPAVDPAGTYTYMVPGTAPCPNATATVTVTVTPEATADAGFSGAVTACAVGGPFVTMGTANGPGTWSGGAGVFANPTQLVTSYVPLVSEYGTTVTLTWTTTDPDGAGPCSSASDDVLVTFIAPPNAGDDDNFTFCSTDGMMDITPVGADPGGTFTPALASGTNMFNPAVDAAGSYTYTVTGTLPCSDETATIIVSLEAAPNAGTGGTFDFCESDAMTNITPAGADAGSFSPALASGTGMFNPAVDGTGTYTYTVTGTSPCLDATTTVTVTVSAASNAGSNMSFTFCSTDAPQDIVPAGADAGTFSPALAGGGTIFDPSLDAAGSYTYNVAGAGACPDASSTISVVVNTCSFACPTFDNYDLAVTICDPTTDSQFTTWSNQIVTGATPLADPDMTFTSFVISSDPSTPTTVMMPPNETHSGADLCASESVMFYALGGCDSDLDGTTDIWTLVGTYDATLVPATQAPIITDDPVACIITIAPACANDILSELGPIDYNGQAAGALDVLGATAANEFGCSATTYDVTHGACANLTCPTVSVIDMPEMVCDGGLTTEYTDWQAMVESMNPASDPDGTFNGVVYSDDPNMVAGAPMITGVHSGADLCQSEMQMAYAFVTCDLDGDGMNETVELAGTFTLEVFPATQGPTVTDNTATCTITITPACAGDVLSFTGPLDYSGQAAGALDVTGATVVNTYGCGLASYDVIHGECITVPCPITFSQDCPESLCSGESAVGFALVIENDNGTGAWYFDPAGTQPYTGQPFVNLTCAMQSDDLYYVVQCDSNGDGVDEPNLIFTHRVDIYPELQAQELVGFDCGPGAVNIVNANDVANVCSTFNGSSAANPVCPMTVETLDEHYEFSFFDGSVCEQFFAGVLVATCSGVCDCPSAATAAPSTEIQCGSANPSFPSNAALGIDDLANAEVSWSPDDSFVVTATCEPRAVVFTPTITCSNDCSISFEGPTHTLTVYPDSNNFVGVVGIDGNCGTDPILDLSGVTCLPSISGPTVLEPTIDGCAANGMPMPDVGEVQYLVEIPSSALSPDGCNAYSETIDLIDDPCDDLCPVVSDFCELSVACVTVSDCDPATGTYSIDVTIVYQLTSGDQIDVTIDGGNTQSIGSPSLGGLSSSVVSFTALTSDASSHAVSAVVVDASGQCSSSASPINYLAPADCTDCAVPNAGTPSP